MSGEGFGRIDQKLPDVVLKYRSNREAFGSIASRSTGSMSIEIANLIGRNSCR